MGLELGNARGGSGVGRGLGPLRLELVQLLGEGASLFEGRLELRLELGDSRGSSGVGRRLGLPCFQLVQVLGESVPLSEDRLQLRLDLRHTRSRGVGRRSRRQASSAALDRVQARADPELGLEEAAVLLGERVCDRALRDEAEVDEDLPERPPGPILLGERMRQLVEGDETLVDHELA